MSRLDEIRGALEQVAVMNCLTRLVATVEMDGRRFTITVQNGPESIWDEDRGVRVETKEFHL